MSLILEALKKSERQRQVGSAPTLATPVMTRRKPRSRLPWLIGAIVIAAGAGWWLSRGDGSAPDTSTPPVAATAAPPVTQAPAAALSEKPAMPMTTVAPPPAAAPVPAAASTPPPATVSVPDSQKKAADAAEVAAAVAAAAPAPAPAPAAAAPAAAPPPLPQTSPTPTRTNPPPAAPPAATTPGTAPAPAVAAAPPPAARNPAAGLPLLWELPYEKRKDMPKLSMSLQVYSAEPASRFAIVNDERRKEGDTIGEGLLLREITPDGLIVEYNGERFLYPRGGR